MFLLFDWHALLFGKENWDYLLQVVIKTVVMFIVVLVSLRLIGRRGIMQGIFPVLTIIMLGSSAGDPMLYSDVGLLPATLVFVMIILLYRIADIFTAKYSKLEKIAEGTAIRFIKDNRFDVEHFKSEELDKDQLASDLRKQGVSQLGQVTAGYIEPGGEISVFFYPDKEVKFGLPLLPERYEKELSEIKKEGYYACSFCGHTEELKPLKQYKCPVCKREKCVEASNDLRMA
jgi:uncharacterized membrane protein YcaP (DUF421 family)